MPKHTDYVEESGEESLAESILIYSKDSHLLLSKKEIEDGWGSCLNFLLSYGIKPWDSDAEAEAVSISRSIKEGELAGEVQSILTVFKDMSEEEIVKMHRALSSLKKNRFG
eukprot:Platyproteum_vivax@DN5353_c0_g1_i3.p2